MKKYLEIWNVTKIYSTPAGPRVIVQDFELSLRKGEFVTLIGHSGCGKSTLLNLVAGLEQPTEGELRLGERTIAGPGPDRGVVFQNYSLLPWMSVWDNIFEAVDSAVDGLSKTEKRERTEHFLHMVGLWEHRLKRPAQISGGMKQRVAVARAFSVHPEVLLLDEPFGALDALTRASLQEELIKLWTLDNSTETVLLVTHDIDEAILLSDRVAVMTRGPAGTIGEVIDVPLDRPRDRQAVLTDPTYREVRERLWYLLTVVYAAAA
jgi:nitrate/nitrite transport system ATP-binding protein